MYSFLVGLIPFMIRFILYLFLKEKLISSLFEISDFVVLGLVLNIGNINELDNLDYEFFEWKIMKIGFSLIFIIIFTAFLVLTFLMELFPEIFDKNIATASVIIVTIGTTIFCYSIYHRMGVMQGENSIS